MLKSAFLLIFLTPLTALAQPTWQSSPPPAPEPVEVFRSTIMANLPTATMLYKGDWHYEISHRFDGSLSGGYDSLFGLDYRANIRMAFGYGISDQFMITLGRSNEMDNHDLQIKHRIWNASNTWFSNALAVQFGLAWNTDSNIAQKLNQVGVSRNRMDSDNFQYYAQLIYNARLLDNRLAIGLVPSYLYNSLIYSDVYNVSKRQTFTMGTYYQLYLNDMWGIWLEYSPTLSGYQGFLNPSNLRNVGNQRSHDSLSSGVSIETGGHVFYFFATNNTRLNSTQYLVGSPYTADPSNWRLGFAITRYL